ncbi:Hypothetical protein YALI2_A00079g [Yarrowia lipolytica]|jgi:hypothetical protein|nr:Hypothetical protein YALI2_A00079g [Yarrowia lipolytica]
MGLGKKSNNKDNKRPKRKSFEQQNHSDQPAKRVTSLLEAPPMTKPTTNLMLTSNIVLDKNIITIAIRQDSWELCSEGLSQELH